MDDLITLKGRISYILFSNESNYYTVAKFNVIDGDVSEIVITGMLPNIEKNHIYEVRGNYVEHPKYGYQFNVLSFQEPLPTQIDGIIRYLSSERFEGIGKKKAEKIVTLLGEDCLTLIKDNPDVLTEVVKLKEKDINVILNGLKDDDSGLQALIQFMNLHGLSTRSLTKIKQKYGNDALNVLKEDPYQVCIEVDGFGFESADKLGMSLGFKKDSEKRVQAYLITLLDSLCMHTGNTCILKDELQKEFMKKTKEYQIDFETLLNECVTKGYIQQDEEKIYPCEQFEAETFIAKFLLNYPYTYLDKIDRSLFLQYLEDLQKDIGIVYDVTQIQALETFFDEPFLIMTGGPGTGKTTVVKAMVTLFRMLYPEKEVMCAAPTGRAAKRLSELTGSKSYTIHSLLQWNLDSNEFKKNEQEPLTCDLLIIDEFSMVDNYLFYNLLKASRHIKKICIIGDEDQLPSVSPGSVLRDLIRTNIFPLVRLNHIYRQKEGSEVISFAHDIRKNDIDLSRYHEDISFFETDEINIKNAILQVVERAIQKGYNMEDIQVLSPMYKGSGGIDVLNVALQQKFNPKDSFKNEIKSGFTTFREGDKVLQLKNQTEDDIYNGDIGEIIEIIPSIESEDRKTTIVVDFQGNIIEYKPENFQNITLAYCISVHKSQGSEYPIVILPIQKQHFRMLSKKLIYTAITRSRRSLVMIGNEEVLKEACHTIDRQVRKSFLSERFMEENS